MLSYLSKNWNNQAKGRTQGMELLRKWTWRSLTQTSQRLALPSHSLFCIIVELPSSYGSQGHYMSTTSTTERKNTLGCSLNLNFTSCSYSTLGKLVTFV